MAPAVSECGDNRSRWTSRRLLSLTIKLGRHLVDQHHSGRMLRSKSGQFQSGTVEDARSESEIVVESVPKMKSDAVDDDEFEIRMCLEERGKNIDESELFDVIVNAVVDNATQDIINVNGGHVWRCSDLFEMSCQRS